MKKKIVLGTPGYQNLVTGGTFRMPEWLLRSRRWPCLVPQSQGSLQGRQRTLNSRARPWAGQQSSHTSQNPRPCVCSLTHFLTHAYKASSPRRGRSTGGAKDWPPHIKISIICPAPVYFIDTNCTDLLSSSHSPACLPHRSNKPASLIFNNLKLVSRRKVGSGRDIYHPDVECYHLKGPKLSPKM